MNLCQYLLENGDKDQPALLTLNRTYSYGDLWTAAVSVSRFLRARGGTKGDRVLLISENSLLWVAAYLGALHAGMVCVPLPASSSMANTKAILDSIEPRFAVVEQRSLMKLLPELVGVTVISEQENRTSEVEVVGLHDLLARNHSVDIPPVEVSENDLAALMFTSGSTSTPRGVMVSVRNIVANTNSIVEYLSLTSSDRMMTVLPFHYCFGASLLHTHLRVGGSLVLDPRFMYPDSVLKRMQETECTGFAGVPSHYQILLRRSSLANLQFPRLRYVQQAGGHLAPAFVKELQNALPRTAIFVMYGQTEATARLAYLSPEFLEAKKGSIGKAIPGVRLSVIDETGQPVLPGDIGEVVAEGDNITQGYWRDESETLKYFRDGKLYTGDLATIDEDGFIFLIDRAKDFLKCGGKRVSCRSLEDTLLDCGLLVEAVVIGIPDPILGEAVKAFVVPRNRNQDALHDQVLEYCRARMALPLVPKEIVVLDSLPKNSSGKVLKAALREQAVAVNS